MRILPCLLGLIVLGIPLHAQALEDKITRCPGRTLIVNLPGSTGGVKDGLAVLSDLVEHAIELVRGEKTGH